MFLTGLNLTCANYKIELDGWWNPFVSEQATGRVYRIGQKKPVNLVYFCDWSFALFLKALVPWAGIGHRLFRWHNRGAGVTRYAS